MQIINHPELCTIFGAQGARAVGLVSPLVTNITLHAVVVVQNTEFMDALIMEYNEQLLSIRVMEYLGVQCTDTVSGPIVIL